MMRFEQSTPPAQETKTEKGARMLARERSALEKMRTPAAQWLAAAALALSAEGCAGFLNQFGPRGTRSLSMEPGVTYGSAGVDLTLRGPRMSARAGATMMAVPGMPTQGEVHVGISEGRGVPASGEAEDVTQIPFITETTQPNPADAEHPLPGPAFLNVFDARMLRWQQTIPVGVTFQAREPVASAAMRNTPAGRLRARWMHDERVLRGGEWVSRAYRVESIDLPPTATGMTPDQMVALERAEYGQAEARARRGLRTYQVELMDSYLGPVEGRSTPVLRYFFRTISDTQSARAAERAPLLRGHLLLNTAELLRGSWEQQLEANQLYTDVTTGERYLVWAQDATVQNRDVTDPGGSGGMQERLMNMLTPFTSSQRRGPAVYEDRVSDLGLVTFGATGADRPTIGGGRVVTETRTPIPVLPHQIAQQMEQRFHRPFEAVGTRMRSTPQGEERVVLLRTSAATLGESEQWVDAWRAPTLRSAARFGAALNE